MTGARVRAAGGLTLVELVVALAVLSMVVLVLGASLRGMAQTAQRLDVLALQQDEERVARAFLQELTARMSPQTAPTAPPRLLFGGASEAMQWVAIMPARFGAAGRFFFRLALEPAADGTPAMVLRYAPWPGPSDFPDWSQAQARVLAHGVTALELDYGGEGWSDGWTAVWDQPLRLPPRVRLRVQTGSRAWAPLVLPLRAAAPAEGGFTVGGGTR